MSDETPRQASAVWAMLLTVVMAWLACGIYRWRVPPLVESRVTVQVPAATDLGTLCQRPDMQAAAALKLEADRTDPLMLDPCVATPQLSGKILARKLSTLGQRATVSPADAADAASNSAGRNVQRTATETWELSYCTRQADRSLDELSALVAVLKQQILSGTAPDEANSRHEYSTVRIAELEERLLDTELLLETFTADEPTESQRSERRRDATATGLETLAEDEPAGSSSAEPIAQQQRIESLQQALSQAREERERSVEEWKLVDQEFHASRQLTTVATQVEPGPVQDVIRQLIRKRDLSAELTRLNQAEQRFSEVYGDKHPKLLEVRARFDKVLTELGGWDEVVDESRIGERLKVSVESVLAEQNEAETDLELQLELEQEKSAADSQVAQRRSQLTSQQETLQRELAAAQESLRMAKAGAVQGFVLLQPPSKVDLPWFLRTGVLFGLATVCGLAAGKMIHRTWFPPTSANDEDDVEPPYVPSFHPAPEAQLDLAQRRAVRQARLKQVYA